jgi:hypothetical protein
MPKIISERSCPCNNFHKTGIVNYRPVFWVFVIAHIPYVGNVGGQVLWCNSFVFYSPATAAAATAT